MARKFECYYGESGSGKSSAAAAMIAKLYQENGKPFRVCVGDGSAATYEDCGLVDAGAVEIVDYTMRDWPLSTLKQLMEGYWPLAPEDPRSKLHPMEPDDYDKIGGYIIEGLSVGSAYIMGDRKGGLAERSGRGEKIGQDSPIRVVDVEVDSKGRPMENTGTGLAFGGNPLAHFNFVQARIRGLLQQSKSLPGLVIWTAHEKTAEDRMSGEKVIGPEAAGQALTASLPRDFNNTVHFALASKKTGKKLDPHTGKQVENLDVEYRIYTRDHYDPDGLVFVRYKAVTRIADPSMMPLFLSGDKPGDAIQEYYEIIGKAREAARTKLVKGVA